MKLKNSMGIIYFLVIQTNILFLRTIKNSKKTFHRPHDL